MCPIGLDPDQTVALEVRGNSMYPVINDGWIVFYTRDHPGVPTESLNQTCVVKVANDGPTLLKHLHLDRGAENRFTLVSFNAPQMDNIEVEWAAPILDWQSAKVARAQPIAA
jgi:phage repressor protein C with HTH and peptisase S24 domain